MSDLNYVSAGEVRKKAHNIPKQVYSDQEINEIIQRHSMDLHIKLGRSRSEAFTESDDKWETVQLYVLYASALEILSSTSIGGDEFSSMLKMVENSLNTLTGDTGTQPIQSAHYDLIDGINEDHYGRQF